MSNVISGRVKVYDVYEHTNRTQTKKFSNVLADCLKGVNQAPCYVKALGAIGVLFGTASTLTYTFLCADNFTSGNSTAVNETVSPTSDNESPSIVKSLGCISSGVLAGLSVVSLAGYTYLSCARASQLEEGELEIGVNDELNRMVIKYGDIEETIDLNAPNFITKMRRQMLKMCEFAMETDGEVADPYELVEMVCKYVDSLRENDSCTVFVLRSITEWFENKHFVKFRDYQVKSGRTLSVSLENILEARNEALASVQTNSSTVVSGKPSINDVDGLVKAEFVFSTDSLTYDNEFEEIPLQ